MALAGALAVMVLATERPAGAQPANTLAATPAHPRRVVSVTLSPAHLFLPVVELTAEARVMDRLGLAVIAGAGRVTSDRLGSPRVTIPVWEAGAQVRYYVLGDFRHGMQLGAEALYLRATADSQGVSAVADGFSAGGFAGYKVMADIGFTFEGQLGYQVMGIGATATDGQTSESRSTRSSGLLLNLNVGWSF